MAELLDSCVCWCTVRIGCIEEQVQIRMDAFKTRIKAIMELQICDNLDFFANDCFKYGCVEQIAFCHDVFKLASGGIETSAWLLAIENERLIVAESGRCLNRSFRGSKLSTSES